MEDNNPRSFCRNFERISFVSKFPEYLFGWNLRALNIYFHSPNIQFFIKSISIVRLDEFALKLLKIQNMAYNDFKFIEKISPENTS